LKILGVALVLVPAIPIGTILLSASVITFAGAYLTYQAGKLVGQGIVTVVSATANIMNKGFYILASPFRRSESISKELQETILNE
jgi:hypothetical protein